MNTRDEILARIRSAVSGDTQNSEGRYKVVQQRIHKHPVGVLPYSLNTKREILDLFITKATAYDATVLRCSQQRVPAQVAAFLKKHNLPHTIRTGSDPVLKKLFRGKNLLMEILKGPSDGSDLTAVSRAFGAAAETGTLALVSGQDNPTTLNFLPENHIVIVMETDILLHQEDLWEKLRGKYGAGKLPRTVNMITGPSRSADIEQTLAHTDRCGCIFLW